jgi:hypothetical protein
MQLLKHSFALNSSLQGSRRRRGRRRNAGGWHHARPLTEVLEDRTLLSTFTVMDTSDDPSDPGSLRYGVDTEPSGTIINFAPSVTGTILLFPEGPIDITKNVDIEGPGASILAISGGGGTQVFSVSSGVMATIEGLTIAHGAAIHGGAIDNQGDLTAARDAITSNFATGGTVGNTVYSQQGGAIYNESGATLLLSDSTLSGNEAMFGGGINNQGKLTVADDSFTSNSGTGTGSTSAGGGGIRDSGPNLTVTGSRFTGNKRCYSGGGIYVAGSVVTIADSTFDSNSAVSGGSIYDAGTLSLTGCTVSNSVANLDTDAGGGQGGGIKNVGTLTATNCTIVNNMAHGDGGGIANVGSLTLTNTTIADNTAPIAGRFGGGHGGGILTYGAAPAAMVANDCTITGNSSIYGGGVDAGLLTLANTIIAGNTLDPGGGTGPDINGAITTDLGYNLIGNPAGGSGLAPTDLVNVNPLFSALGNYGGPTQTFALLPGSPAIDAGDNAEVPSGITTDQRGPGDPRIVNGRVDIGAFESSGFSVEVSSGNKQETAVSLRFSAPLVVSVVSLAHNEPVAGGLVTFTAPASGASAVFADGTRTDTGAIDSMGQASIGPATADATAGSYTVNASATGVTTGAGFQLTNTRTNFGTPPPDALIISEHSVFRRKHTRDGKLIGKPVLRGFTLKFIPALGATGASNPGNYELEIATFKKVKNHVRRVLHSIKNFKVAYAAGSSVVTLELTGKAMFRAGGQITVLPGVTGESGSVLVGTTTFKITPGGKKLNPVQKNFHGF